MINIKLYYIKEEDTLQMVENGVLKFHEEATRSTNLLDAYLGVESIDELKDKSIEDMIEDFRILRLDFEHWASKVTQYEHDEYIKTQTIRGELIFDKSKEVVSHESI